MVDVFLHVTDSILYSEEEYEVLNSIINTTDKETYDFDSVVLSKTCDVLGKKLVVSDRLFSIIENCSDATINILDEAKIIRSYIDAESFNRLVKLGVNFIDDSLFGDIGIGHRVDTLIKLGTTNKILWKTKNREWNQIALCANVNNLYIVETEQEFVEVLRFLSTHEEFLRW